MQGILSGLRVIEGSAFVAAPSAGMSLAQMGADVIRFDPIGGGLDYTRWPITKDGVSLYWAHLNKGKRSIQIDIGSEAGREIAATLICAPGKDAGLFITNFLAAGWLAYDGLKAKREDLIMLNITGDPDGGTAVDYTVNSATGFPFLTGHETDDTPVNNILPAWDLLCGQSAVVGLLAAERHRQRTGEGQYIRLPLSDVAFAATANLGNFAEYEVEGIERPRTGNDIYGAYGHNFRTADFRQIMIVVVSNRQWKSLVKVTDLSDAMQRIETKTGRDLGKDWDRYEARAEINAVIELWCSTRTLEQIREAFEGSGVMWGPYQTIAQAVNEDWRVSEKNDLFAKVDQPDIGPVLTPRSPIGFTAPANLDPVKAPRLGANTDEILADVLGLGSGEIGRLHDQGTVAGPASK